MDWVACVGVDWADQKHAYAIRTAEGAEGAHGEYSSAPEDVHAWVRWLREQYPTGDILVALEQSRGALMYALSAYDFLRLVPINPRASHAYRQSLHLSGAKDDPKDAVLLRDFCASHWQQLRVWTPDDPVTRQLRLLVEARRNMVDQRTAFILEANDVLKQYFPQMNEWFGGAQARLARAILMRWPTLQHLQAARSDSLSGVIRKHSRKSAARIMELLAAIRQAEPITTDLAINAALSLRTQMLAKLIEPTAEAVTSYDEAIEHLWTTHEDREVFESFPGAGPVMAPRLAAAFGSDRDRFTTAAEIQTLLRHCSGNRKQWQTEMDARTMALSQVLATNLSRVRRSIDPSLHLGQSFLPSTASSWRRPSCGYTLAGLPMDPHSLSMLEAQGTLPGQGLRRLAETQTLSAGRPASRLT